jgi:hypothetical protein
MLDEPAFACELVGAAGVGKSSLAAALVDVPGVADEELARLDISDEETGRQLDAVVWVVRGAPAADAVAEIERLRRRARHVLIAIHNFDGADVRPAWQALVPPALVHRTATPPGAPPAGVDELRIAIVSAALDGADLSVARARRARRPFAVSLIAGAAAASAVEGLVPGTAAFVLATQASAISSLYYLYTGKWLGRAQLPTLATLFATEATGSGLFLIVKSFLPPTGIADVIAAGVAASMTLSLLGAVAWLLEQGYSLDEREQLVRAFRRMRARTRAERLALRQPHRFADRSFWIDLVRRLVFG